MAPTREFAGATLSVDLGAIANNWRNLAARLGTSNCAGVVKADAYGLGMTAVAPVLADAGCGLFFTANIDEAIALRAVLPSVEIGVLYGPGSAEDAAACGAHGLIPVINHLDQLIVWRNHAKQTGQAGVAMLHVDTGMARLAMPAAEIDHLTAHPDLLDGCRITHVLSHLACADQPGDLLNETQRQRFEDARTLLTPVVGSEVTWSLANSSGIFLGPPWHFGLARPGAALYGINPTPGTPNPMRPVVQLQGKILQVQHVDSPQTVGYGAAHVVKAPARVATVAVGYADGYLRSGGGLAHACLGEIRVPIIGRVSMDMITLDITSVPDDVARPGVQVDLIGDHYSVDSLAADAGTIGYEVLTSLGNRYQRNYINSPLAAATS